MLALSCALTTFVSSPARAQSPTDAPPPPPPPPPPMPDAVSGEPSPTDNPSTGVPVPPPTPTDATATQPGTTPPPAGTEPAAAPTEPGAFTRKGFYFSFGIGTSIIGYQLDLREDDALTYAGNITELVPATLLKIGYGVGPQTAVHFTNRIAWLNHNDWAAIDHHERIWTMSSFSGLGVSHFLDKDQRSWYIGADLGVSQWLAFSDIQRDIRDIGFGFCLEVGSQFFKGLSFEHSVCYGTVMSHRRDADGGTERDADLGMPLTASFTLNYLK